MRKVKFKKWIPIQYNEHHRAVSGTGCFEEDYTQDGIFHCWGLDCIEYESSGCSYTVAIIEVENGEVLKLDASKIKFMPL